MPRHLLARADGVDLVDDPAKLLYPTPKNATKKFNIEAGRVRQSIVFGAHGLDLLVSGDQLLRGAALNAVLIAEYVESPYESKFAKKKPHTGHAGCPLAPLAKLGGRHVLFVLAAGRLGAPGARGGRRRARDRHALGARQTQVTTKKQRTDNGALGASMTCSFTS